ncbi:MAG: hypothetical protein WC236_11975 [Gallionellaceae bacterium]|jgi:hypothetical protein
MSELGTFSTAAKGLARNPLGIIALFIVLIYGFASLTLGVNTALQTAERLPLVWFLVIFPVIVLLTFAWLVSAHHEKLYGPGDYKTDEGFLEGMKTRARFEAELRAQQEQLKASIRETLTESGAPSSTSQDIDKLMEKLSNEIDRATTVTVDARGFLDDPNAVFHLPIAAFKSLNDLTDAVFFKLTPAVRPFEYGYSWVLRNKDGNKIVRNARMITLTEPGQPMPDTRTLGEVGIKAGSTLIVEPPK